METEERREHKPTADKIVERARAGESFTLHSRAYASGNFVKIAAACAEGGGHLTILEAGKIEQAGGSHVTLA